MSNQISYALLTDLYELTMMQGYFFTDAKKDAVFDMFFRRQPFDGGFSVFAGLDPLLDAIESLRFSAEDIEYLDQQQIFKPEFLKFLADFTFKGDIHAVSEGSVVFPNEPLLRVHGNIMEAQLLETMLLNTVNFQTLIATKAARVKDAAGSDAIMEFGLRRAQGENGAVSGARGAFIGGADATSNVLAGKRYNIPIAGTMAHGWIMNFNTELEAFQAYADLYPENCILLVDTFDTLKSGVPNAIEIFKQLQQKGIHKFGIRLDSGDLYYLSKEARKIFDQSGVPEAKIYVSNELDEWVITQLKKDNAPIDAWGVGTRLITGDKDPALSGVYKIVARRENGAFIPTIKISDNPEKTSNPGIKNVMRFTDRDGKILADLLYLEEERDELMEKLSHKETIRLYHPSVDYSHFDLEDYHQFTPLLQPVMENGKRLHPPKPLNEIKAAAAAGVSSLWSGNKRLVNPQIYKVSLTDRLKQLKYTMIKDYRP